MGRFPEAASARHVAIDEAKRLGCGIIIQSRGGSLEWFDPEQVRGLDDGK